MRTNGQDLDRDIFTSRVPRPHQKCTPGWKTFLKFNFKIKNLILKIPPRGGWRKGGNSALLHSQACGRKEMQQWRCPLCHTCIIGRHARAVSYYCSAGSNGIIDLFSYYFNRVTWETFGKRRKTVADVTGQVGIPMIIPRRRPRRHSLRWQMSHEFVPPLITLPERVSTLHELAQREPCNMLIELDRRRQYLVTQSNAHRGYPHARDLTLIQDAWHRFVLNIYTLRVT